MDTDKITGLIFEVMELNVVLSGNVVLLVVTVDGVL